MDENMPDGQKAARRLRRPPEEKPLWWEQLLEKAPGAIPGQEGRARGCQVRCVIKPGPRIQAGRLERQRPLPSMALCKPRTGGPGSMPLLISILPAGGGWRSSIWAEPEGLVQRSSSVSLPEVKRNTLTPKS